MLVNAQTTYSAFTIKQDKALLKTASLALEARLSKEELVEVTDKVRDAFEVKKNKLALRQISICNMGIGLELQPMESTISRSLRRDRDLSKI